MNAEQCPNFAAILMDRLNDQDAGERRSAEIERYAEAVAVRFTRNALRQLFDRYEPSGISASSLGKCKRALAYLRSGIGKDGRDIDARARLTFAVGDQTESFLALALLEALASTDTGWHLENSILSPNGQSRATVEINGQPIPGSADGVLVNKDGTRIVLEIKSANSYAHEKWGKIVHNGGLPWGADESYYWQNQVYQRSYDAQGGYVLAFNKDNGHLIGWFQPFDHSFDMAASKHLANIDDPNTVPRMLPNGMPLVPVRNFSDKTGNPLKGDGKLPWQCHYCAYWKECYGADAYEDTINSRKALLIVPEKIEYYRDLAETQQG